jgi:hypothetical protein
VITTLIAGCSNPANRKQSDVNVGMTYDEIEPKPNGFMAIVAYE